VTILKFGGRQESLSTHVTGAATPIMCAVDSVLTLLETFGGHVGGRRRVW